MKENNLGLKIAAAVGAMALVPAVLLVLCLIIPLVGAFTGAAFQWVFHDTATQFMLWTGLNMEFWQLSAVTAFFGGFFKATLTTSK